MSAPLPAYLIPTLAAFGVVHEMPMDTYQAVNALSNGGLQMLSRSPAHLFAWTQDARRPARGERPGQLEGTLAHCMILEPGEYPFRYVVGPPVSRATKEWKEFVARHPGFVCLKPDQAESANRQAASVRAHPDVAKLLARGHAEVSAFWTDPVTGVACKCRPDWVHPIEGQGVILLDVKTYSDASPAEFARQVARKRYHWQAAWYSDGYAIAAGVPVLGFVFVAVESEWPFAASAVMLDDESLDIARREIRPLVLRYKECNASGVWPGYPIGIEQIQLPAWYTQRAGD
jgi:hypothetical protein